MEKTYFDNLPFELKGLIGANLDDPDDHYRFASLIGYQTNRKYWKFVINQILNPFEFKVPFKDKYLKHNITEIGILEKVYEKKLSKKYQVGSKMYYIDLYLNLLFSVGLRPSPTDYDFILYILELLFHFDINQICSLTEDVIVRSMEGVKITKKFLIIRIFSYSKNAEIIKIILNEYFADGITFEELRWRGIVFNLLLFEIILDGYNIIIRDNDITEVSDWLHTIVTYPISSNNKILTILKDHKLINYASEETKNKLLERLNS